ncbi:unnamed protein product [Ranitomeya imitator]|uniref:Acetylcholine receptor subunit delta n=1 Tax=Ranitomeya imitator TaxID=111125 RepID=A0ABN9LYJ4_9NEOB|nr:unnamed protein product [Ranitomeya imitator]
MILFALAAAAWHWLLQNEKREALTTNVWVEMQWIDYRLSWKPEEHGGIEITRVFPPPWSQTYNANEIELLLTVTNGETIEGWIEIDPQAFTENGEWAIKHMPAKKIIDHRHTPDDINYQAIVFYLIIQRKPLFYIINIIVPCVLISFVSVLVYFLPAKAGGQKCTVSINILLAQTVFLFLIAKKIPETSTAVPLIVKLFLRKLPRLLKMHLPQSDSAPDPGPLMRRSSSLGLIIKADEYMMRKPISELMFEKQKQRDGLMKTVLEKIGKGIGNGTVQDLIHSLSQASPEIQDMVEACNHIARTTREKKEFKSAQHMISQAGETSPVHHMLHK